MITIYLWNKIETYILANLYNNF